MRAMVLDPTAKRPEPIERRRAAGSSDLNGKVVGLRVDIMWRSWDWVSDVWTAALESKGAEVRPWRAGARFGEDGDRYAAELEQWAAEVDLAVVGLAN